MVRVYCYVTVVSLQYLTPLILTLSCTLLLKTLGEKRLGARRVGAGCVEVRAAGERSTARLKGSKVAAGRDLAISGGGAWRARRRGE